MANSINPFTIKPPSPTSSSSLTSMKLKTLLQTFIFSHMYRLVRAVSKAKSVLIQLLKDIHLIHLVEIFPGRKNKKKNLFFGSFRLHYNWGSSHDHNVPIVLESCPNSNSHVYYDSTWSASMLYDEMQGSNELSKYLKWLEEKGGEDCCDEIDRIADLFIANCHEKFRLEKVESYRRFQEMMARSVIPAFEEAILGMAPGGIRRIIVPPELGYPENDYNKKGPRPSTFSGQRALDFVLGNQGLIDKTLLFDIELLKIVPNASG